MPLVDTFIRIFVRYSSTLLLMTPTILFSKPIVKDDVSNDRLRKPRLKIGMIIPTSGPMRQYGQQVLNGAEIAIKQLSNDDEDLAQRLIIVKEDNEGLQGTSTKKADKLLNVDHVHILFGGILTSNSQVISDIANKAKKPFLTPASTHDLITKSPYTFRSCLMDTNQGKLMGKFAYKNLRKRSALLLSEADSLYSRTIADSFKEYFQSIGGQVVGEVSYRPDQKAYPEVANEISMHKPDIIIHPGHYMDAKRLIDSSRKKGVRAPFLGSDSWDYPKFYSKEQGDILKGNYFLTHFTAQDPDKKVQAFNADYKHTFGTEPTVTAAMGFDGMNVIIAAFKMSDSNRSSKLKKSLEGIECFGFGGVIKMAKDRNAQKPAAIMVTTTRGVHFMTRVRF